MILKSQSRLLFIYLLLLLTSCSKETVFERNGTVYKMGDQLNWAGKDWNDKGWKVYLRYVPKGGVFWSRSRINLLKSPEELRAFGIQLEVYGEYEIFWDGVLIGKNGNPGQEVDNEPSGKLWRTFIIPSHLATEGEHVLAIRNSLLYFPDHTQIYALDIDSFDSLFTKQLIQTSYMYILAGAFLIISFYFLFLFLNNRNEYPTVIFSICCFFIFALVLTVFSNDYYSIHYSLHVVRLQIITSFLMGISFLIPVYFSMQFPYARRGVLLIVYAVVLAALFFIKNHAFDFKAVYMVLNMWCFSVGIVAYGIYKKQRGARLVLVSLLLSVVVFLIFGFVVSLYAGLGLILLGMLYLLSLNMKDQRLAYENSLVQSTRLRLELLKKNIQPHFLMNTLTSLIDWVEESPKKGVQFIEELATEFDLVNQMEEQVLVPILKEIELCRTHLKIMEFRKEISYLWEDEGIDTEQMIPPGVLHTLLENGITHSLPLEGNTIQFKLIYKVTTNFRCYTFLTYAETANRSKEVVEGTGIKYVKARLEESFQSKWKFNSVATEEGWKNEIIIYN